MQTKVHQIYALGIVNFNKHNPTKTSLIPKLELL